MHSFQPLLCSLFGFEFEVALATDSGVSGSNPCVANRDFLLTFFTDATPILPLGGVI